MQDRASVITVIVADVPPGATVGLLINPTVGSENANVAPVRLIPVTLRDAMVVPARADFGLREVITGNGMTVTEVAEVTVVPPTVTDTVPVVAFAGTSTCRLFAVAETTVAAIPLIRTTLALAVVLKPCP